jgi:hypothetical protein
MWMIGGRELTRIISERNRNSSGRGKRRRRSEKIESQRIHPKILFLSLFSSTIASFQMNFIKRKQGGRVTRRHERWDRQPRSERKESWRRGRRR